MISGIRVVLTAFTASFRVPSFVRYQLSLPVPPLSTIYGLLSAARGSWLAPDEVEWIAYYCEYEGKGMDLETIITYKVDKPDKSPAVPSERNVINRQFLVMPRLTLYLPRQWAEFFRRPRYSLLLGRTQDLATVESITEVELTAVEEGKTSGVIIPLEIITNGNNNVRAQLMNLPIAFSDDVPRRLLGMKVFGVLDAGQGSSTIKAPGWLVEDKEEGNVIPLYRREWIVSQLV